MLGSHSSHLAGQHVRFAAVSEFPGGCNCNVCGNWRVKVVGYVDSVQFIGLEIGCLMLMYVVREGIHSRMPYDLPLVCALVAYT